MKFLPSFYKSFYGHKFFRHFRRPPDFKHKGFKVQFTVTNAKELYSYVHHNSGFHPCFVQTYDHGSLGNLNRNHPKLMIFDRAFFDFDIHNYRLQKIKKELQDLRSNGLKYKSHLQEELKDQLQNLIINERIAEPAIIEAKNFSIKIKESFGSYPILFFSGGKGCHAFILFNPIQHVDINRALFWFGNHVRNTQKYDTIDLSVLKDSKSRLSRIPYSKHQYTHLTVVPFTIQDSYDIIIEKSLNPQVEKFQKENHLSTFGEYLKKIDPILRHNEKIKKITCDVKKVGINGFKNFKGMIDHRVFFKDLLGPPNSEYHDKEYVMYCCPFPNHADNNPSFMVHKKGYKCYGCEKKGNYWQFLKDYNSWNDQQVREYLRKKNMGIK